MNTSLTRAPQHTASASSLPVVETTALRRLGLLDRLSLRLGLWLLARADHAAVRAADAASAAHRARRNAHERALREADWQRKALHLRPPL